MQYSVNEKFAWAAVAIFAVWTFCAQSLLPASIDPFTRNIIEKALLSAVFISSSLCFYTAMETAVFALISFVITNLFENIGVMTGFPFGPFEHSTATGPRLFHIPWIASPMYISLAFVCWMVGLSVCGRIRRADQSTLGIFPPIVAAFVFTMWDVCNDAVFHTVNRAFFYHDPGPWFGVPASNFWGWLLMTSTLYFAVTAWLRLRFNPSCRPEPPARVLWLPLSAYAIIAAGGIFRNVMGVSRVVTLSNGVDWNTGDVFGSMNIATVFTMGFVIILAASRLLEDPRT